MPNSHTPETKATSFSAKEKDEETQYSYFGARYYNSDISIWLSVDPMADQRSWVSPYNYCQNNPIRRVDPTGALDSDHIDVFGNVIAHYDDGDKSVYVHKYGTTEAQVDAQRTASNNTGGSGTKIGEIGGNIDVSEIMSNKLKVSSEVAKNINGLGEFADWVKAGSVWDLKGNEKTIFGVAWAYDQANKTETTFNFGGYSNMTAADVGNYHFGYIGRYTNNGKGFSENTLWIGAGLVEIKKNIFDEGKFFTGLSGMTQLLGPIGPRPPYGDRMVDFIWSTMGMIDADKSKKR